MGSISYALSDQVFHTPVFSSKVVDTIGAGDAVLGITSLLEAKQTKIEIIAYLGNMFGALATKYLGHSSQIMKKDLSKAIMYSLK